MLTSATDENLEVLCTRICHYLESRQVETTPIIRTRCYDTTTRGYDDRAVVALTVQNLCIPSWLFNVLVRPIFRSVKGYRLPFTSADVGKGIKYQRGDDRELGQMQQPSK